MLLASFYRLSQPILKIFNSLGACCLIHQYAAAAHNNRRPELGHRPPINAGLFLSKRTLELVIYLPCACRIQAGIGGEAPITDQRLHLAQADDALYLSTYISAATTTGVKVAIPTNN